MAGWVERNVVRDARGRFSDKPGGGSSSGSSSGGLAGFAAREKAQVEMLSRVSDIRKPHPMTWGDPKTKKGLHAKFEDAAEDAKRGAKTPACAEAVKAARIVLGFKSSQTPPTQPDFSVDSGVGDPKVAKERLSALATGYRGLADSDHPATHVAQEAADTIQNLATGMGLGSLDEQSASPKMNAELRKRAGRGQ